jgi:hypothetical protein
VKKSWIRTVSAERFRRRAVAYAFTVVALKDDDADDEEAEAEEAREAEAKLIAKEEQNARGLAAKPKIKQPTGRVVGVIKRNWRA